MRILWANGMNPPFSAEFPTMGTTRFPTMGFVSEVAHLEAILSPDGFLLSSPINASKRT